MWPLFNFIIVTASCKLAQQTDDHFSQFWVDIFTKNEIANLEARVESKPPRITSTIHILRGLHWSQRWLYSGSGFDSTFVWPWIFPIGTHVKWVKIKNFRVIKWGQGGIQKSQKSPNLKSVYSIRPLEVYSKIGKVKIFT